MTRAINPRLCTSEKKITRKVRLNKYNIKQICSATRQNDEIGPLLCKIYVLKKARGWCVV